jgi:PilZ domain-containing protein
MEKTNELAIRPIGPLADQFKAEHSASEAEDLSAGTFLQTIADVRRQPRYKIDVEIRIDSRTCGFLKGRTVDISESGIAAMLTIEAPLGEVVELSFTLPLGPVAIHGDGSPKERFSLRLRVR